MTPRLTSPARTYASVAEVGIAYRLTAVEVCARLVMLESTHPAARDDTFRRTLGLAMAAPVSRRWKGYWER